VRSPINVTIAGLVVLVGLLFGGMLALLTRPMMQQTQQTQRAAVASKSTNAPPVPHSRPPAVAPAAPPATTPSAPVTSAATATPAATAAPSGTAASPATNAPATNTRAGSSSAAAVVAPRAGLWQIQEANIQVGTIVWAGRGVASSGSSAIALDVHKTSVAGHGVSLCERQTTLHAVITAGASPQTVPYQEVNCSGVTSNGEMRVTSFSPDGRSFSGSFWSSGSKLGDFTAQGGP